MTAPATATDRLTWALGELAAVGERTPCQDPDVRDWWLSDDPEEREAASHRCHGCPVMELCGTAADENRERWGVWSGRDRSPRPRRARTTEATGRQRPNSQDRAESRSDRHTAPGMGTPAEPQATQNHDNPKEAA